MKRSALLTKAMAEKAIALLTPSILAMLAEWKRIVVYIVILDPVSGEVVWEGAIGETDKAKWGDGKTYDVNALRKAKQVWETGLPNHVVLFCHPHLAQGEDFVWYGGTNIGGLPVGTSGAACWQDLIVSSAVSTTLGGMCMGAYEDLVKQPKVMVFPAPAEVEPKRL